MKIYGIEITPQQIEAAESRMRKGNFYSYEIDRALQLSGVPDRGPKRSPLSPPEFVAMRAADRLIQKHRKLGNIRYVKGAGFWTSLTAPKHEGLTP